MIIGEKYGTFVKEEGKWKFRSRNFIIRAGGDTSLKNKKAPTRGTKKPDRNEMTLDRCIFHLQQPRVISLNS